MVGVRFATLEPEHCVLILLGERDVGSSKIKIFEGWAGFFDGSVGKFTHSHEPGPGDFKSCV